jgi:hypothetical protein
LKEKQRRQLHVFRPAEGRQHEDRGHAGGRDFNDRKI